MKKLIIILTVITFIFGCATLGFEGGEVTEEKVEKVTDKVKEKQSGRGIELVYKDATATSVSVAGEFNNWDASANPMQKDGENWKINLELEPGKYPYKFVVNGTDWKPDPNCSETIDDGYGGQNSLLVVGGIKKVKSKKTATTKSGNVEFSFNAPDAASVFLAGDFNEWNSSDNPLENDNGTWKLSLDLDPGKYMYKFVVNGTDWKPDPNNPETEDDGYGGENSVITVDGKVETKKVEKKSDTKTGEFPIKFSYQPLIGGKHEIFVAGDFNNWSPNMDKMEENNGLYETTLHLKKGKYGYKFVVDGNWLTDENAVEFAGDGFGGQNSIIYVGDRSEINALRKVEFKYDPGKIVKEVYLVGGFNAWNQKSDKMEKNEDGSYSIFMLLKPDEYPYKFLEDGMNWITDQNAESFIDDGFGGKNSVIIVDDRFEKVTIEKKDGVILTYGIPTSQSLETVNPLSPTEIEFKTKAHSGDVEKVYLKIERENETMNLIAEDGSFDYYRKIIKLKNEDEEFDYCFVYEDGGNEYYLMNGVISKTFDKNKLFHYSKKNVQPFFTPDWVKKGVIYQIFMDRFYNGNDTNNQDFSEWYYDGINNPPEAGKKHTKYKQYFHFVDDWYDVSGLTKSPYHEPNHEGYQPDYNSFYGGDVAGIKQKLDYLTDLGITIIYFNPLFEAKSNHKYDAVDYMKIDPHFGTEAEFKELVQECHKRGIRIILDVAFNHTGETFFAFQEGMKNGPDSEYYNWFEWNKWPMPDPAKTPGFKPSDYYECWWGFGEMPNLNYDLKEPNPSENGNKDINQANPNWEVVNYILGLVDYWIGDVDLDGFRLDVPNEVPFWFWQLFREKVKSVKPDAYLVGELWSNAVEWVNNDYFDSVMNYAYFKDPVMRFFNMRKCSAQTFDRDLKPGLLSYPTQATQVMMNLIDSHDTHRYLESAGGDLSKLKLAALFQMTYVGTPHIWYGDEVGMMGAHDPDCRRPFNWKYAEDKEKVELRDFYKKLIKIRKENQALYSGSFKTLLTKGMLYAFQRSYEGSDIVVVINNEVSKQTIELDTNLGKRSVTDLLTGNQYQLTNGNTLEIELEAGTGAILK